MQSWTEDMFICCINEFSLCLGTSYSTLLFLWYNESSLETEQSKLP